MADTRLRSGSRKRKSTGTFFSTKDVTEEGKVYDLEDVKGLRNYLVDLATQKILGETGSKYFYTINLNGHRWKVFGGFRKCNVTWSPDSTFFVQLYTEEWGYRDCHAGKIVAGPKLAGIVDLGNEIEKQTFGFLKKRPSSGELRMHVDQVSNDGDILFKVEGVSQREEKVLFTLYENLRLLEAPAGLQPETVSVTRAPKE